MNRTELEALLAAKMPAPVSSESLQASYEYLLALASAEDADLDELKKHLDTLGRLKDLLTEGSKTAIGKVLQTITLGNLLPEKLRQRVESFKRVTWGLIDERDPIEITIAIAVADLDSEDADARAMASEWLRNNKDLLPPAPVEPPALLDLLDRNPQPSPPVRVQP
jgi:hypothetical protein